MNYDHFTMLFRGRLCTITGHVVPADVGVGIMTEMFHFDYIVFKDDNSEPDYHAVTDKEAFEIDNAYWTKLKSEALGPTAIIKTNEGDDFDFIYPPEEFEE